MRVLVIGGTGFIGGAIVRAAVQRGWQVRATRRNESRCGAVCDLAEQGLIEWFSADLANLESMTKAMSGCQLVFHAAGYYPMSNWNGAGQLRQAQDQIEAVLESFRRSGADRLVYTSSLSKMVMEQAVLESGLQAVVLCPTSVFGPGDVKPTSGVLIINVARGLLPFYVDGCNNAVDVRDLAATQLVAAERGQTGERYIVGGENLSFRQIISIIAGEAGRRPPHWRLPQSVVRLAGSLAGRLGIMGGDVLQAIPYWQVLDTSKARTELGHSSRPFAETVRDALAWFREHGYL
jgi:dihydroflavonol-4-reductase